MCPKQSHLPINKLLRVSVDKKKQKLMTQEYSLILRGLKRVWPSIITEDLITNYCLVHGHIPAYIPYRSLINKTIITININEKHDNHRLRSAN